MTPAHQRALGMALVASAYVATVIVANHKSDHWPALLAGAWPRAVAGSNIAGLMMDSALFVPLTFGSFALAWHRKLLGSLQPRVLNKRRVESGRAPATAQVRQNTRCGFDGDIGFRSAA